MRNKELTVLPDDSVAKELYQRLTDKVQRVANKITEQVHVTTKAWNQPIHSDGDALSSTSKTKL